VSAGRPTATGWLRRTASVAAREFVQTVFTKAFLLSVVALPILGVVGFTLIPLLLPEGPPPLRGEIVVVDPGGGMAAPFERRLEEILGDEEPGAGGPGDGMPTPDAIGRLIESTERAALAGSEVSVRLETDAATLEDAKALVRDGGAVAVLDVRRGDAADGGATPPIESWVMNIRSDLPARQVMLLERLAESAAVEVQVERAGEDLARLRSLMKPPPGRTMRLSEGGGEAPEQVEAKMLVPMGFMMLLWVSVVTSANYLLMSTIEEKSNRVMEVLLSAISPMQLMAGKILGYGLVGAILVGAYGGLAIAGLAAATMLDLVPAAHLLLFAVYFVMAYFTIASLLAAVGSAVTELRDAQSLMGPVMLVMVVPLILWLPISEDPNGGLATVASFVPPLTPFVMILRTTGSAEPVAVWQIAATIVWGSAVTVGCMWLAARIFRVGVLMQGKPPTPLELLRWIRHR
jgi:ABC-type Na+ efflux pump permease subunit